MRAVNDRSDFSFRWIENERYRSANNSYSVYLALRDVSDPLIIVNSDVLFHWRILAKLASSPFGNALVVDFDSGKDDEDMRVICQEGAVRDIGKDIPIRDSSGEYIGLMKLDRTGATEVLKRLEQWARLDYWSDWYEGAVRLSLDKVQFRALSTDGLPWIEIDHTEDLARARREVYPLLEPSFGK